MLPVLRLLLIASFFFKYNSTSRFRQLHESSASTPKHRYIAFLWSKQLHKKKKAKWNLASEAQNTEGKGKKTKQKPTGDKGKKKSPFFFLLHFAKRSNAVSERSLKVGGWQLQHLLFELIGILWELHGLGTICTSEQQSSARVAQRGAENSAHTESCTEIYPRIRDRPSAQHQTFPQAMAKFLSAAPKRESFNSIASC